ncbi:MAG: outer membrane protein assembly factor BamD [Gammaproteobacteria bacterium]|nr:outer membrane protein assembly factor BamD [Gammaproteobacteria bacterium]
MKIHNLFAAAALALLLSGCSMFGDKEEEIPENTAQELYDAAKQSLKNENWPSAVGKLEALDSRYPFGPFSHQGQLDLIYAYYKNGDHEDAVSNAERFIKSNPSHPNVDYAYYMKGLAQFQEDEGFFAQAFNADQWKRDTSSAKKGFDSFAELLRQFPNSKYGADARQRMVHLRNRLAQYELYVASYYLRREIYVAAASRARYVVEKFPQSNAVGDALVVLVQAYDRLNLKDQADNARKTLQLNYPDKAASPTQ